jgi:site-specific DNA-methyltransferase (adenine-specific)
MKGMPFIPELNREVLAIVDPPFFSGPNKKNYYKGGNSKKYIDYSSIEKWEVPKQNYFNELLKVSANQIIWGINYFHIKYIGPGRIIWDKKNSTSSFSDAEIAFCGLENHVRIFRYLWNGFLQENLKEKEIKIHPTQKPIALYKWCLQKYARPGQLILDTHMGSGSLICACIEEGYDYIAFETDKYYYQEADKRIQEFKKRHKRELFKKSGGKIIK